MVSNGCALRVADTGEGSVAVLLLHGYLESLDIFDEFTWLLADRVRVVSMDIPGHGVSEVKGDVHTMAFLADTAVGVLDGLGISQAVVVGHSMGGYVALEMLRRHPQRLSGIVLMHALPDADTPERRDSRLHEAEAVLAGRKVLLTRQVPEHMFAAGNAAHFRELQEELAEQIYLTEDEGIVALLRGMAAREDSNRLLRCSSLPQMFIFGRGDRVTPPALAEQTQKEHPQALTVWFEHSGHVSFLEEPQACADAVAAFALSTAAR